MTSQTGFTIQRITQLVSQILIHWIVIYPVDSAIQLLNNWGLVVTSAGHLREWSQGELGLSTKFTTYLGYASEKSTPDNRYKLKNEW